MEGGLTYTQVFDAENRLVSVTVSGQTTQFVYDGDGNLVKKINPDGSRTIYVGGIYSIPFGDEMDKNSGGSVTGTTTYYPVAGAMRVDGTLYYVLKDHLSSASVVTDASGNPSTGSGQVLSASSAIIPSGKRVSPPAPSPRTACSPASARSRDWASTISTRDFTRPRWGGS